MFLPFCRLGITAASDRDGRATAKGIQVMRFMTHGWNPSLHYELTRLLGCSGRLYGINNFFVSGAPANVAPERVDDLVAGRRGILE